MKHKNGLLIGETAEIFGISPDSLRYYDKIGLLKPHINPENKYRWYKEEDIAKLTAIMFFRYLNIPIALIRMHLENHDIESSLDLLKNTESKMQEKIATLQKIRKSVRKKIDLIQRISRKGWEVHTKHIPDRYYMKTSIGIDFEHDTYLDFLTKVHDSPEIQETDILWYCSPDICLLIEPEDPEKNMLTILCPETEKKTGKLQAGTYACLLYSGDSEETVRKAHAKLQHYIKRNSNTADRPLIELWHLGEEITAFKEQFITEIQMRIE